jgi:hypothetical protein
MKIAGRDGRSTHSGIYALVTIEVLIDTHRYQSLVKEAGGHSPKRVKQVGIHGITNTTNI